MHEPTARVRRATRSQIRVMFDRAAAADGDPVRLEVGEPDFHTPAHVVEAAAEAARGGATHYTSNAGLPETRRAISDAMADEYGVEHDVDEIVVTVGGMEALHLATLSVVGPGEELLYPGPAWPNYGTQAVLADGRPVEVPLSAADGYALDADRLTERMGRETAAVVLTTPSNPTGRVYDPDAIRAVVAAAADHDAYVIADDVYAVLTYDREPRGVAAVSGHPDHVLTVGSCSKTYAMTGWRLGWLAGDRSVLDRVVTIREASRAASPSWRRSSNRSRR